MRPEIPPRHFGNTSKETTTLNGRRMAGTKFMPVVNHAVPMHPQWKEAQSVTSSMKNHSAHVYSTSSSQTIRYVFSPLMALLFSLHFIIQVHSCRRMLRIPGPPAAFAEQPQGFQDSPSYQNTGDDHRNVEASFH